MENKVRIDGFAIDAIEGVDENTRPRGPGMQCTKVAVRIDLSGLPFDRQARQKRMQSADFIARSIQRELGGGLKGWECRPAGHDALEVARPVSVAPGESRDDLHKNLIEQALLAVQRVAKRQSN